MTYGYRSMRVCALVFLGLTVLAAWTPEARAQRDASRRFTANQRGDITFAANSIMSCRTGTNGGGISCDTARAATGGSSINNNFTMDLIDADSDATTFDSSGATLSLPTDSTVSFAGLYWYCTDQNVGDPAPVSADRDTVRFRAPGGSYADVTSSVFDDIGSTYQGFADVTTRVQAAGAGEYFVGNIQCANSTTTSVQTNLRGGWALVVAYVDAAQPFRNLVVFDAFRSYSTTAQTITVSGFLTPPAPEVVNSRIGVVFYDGDRGEGDTLTLRCTLPTLGSNVLLGETAAGSLNPTTDIGNSTVTRFAMQTARTPQYVNTLGFDADIFATVNALPNNCSTATIRAITASEVIELGVVTFATDIFVPEVEITKSATDVNGGTLQPGDVLEYTLVTTNAGRDPALDAVVRDAIPTGTTYVGNSLRIEATSPTDGAGDDTAEFDSGMNRVVFRIGTGATTATGGVVGVGETITLRFRVRINPAIAAGTVIRNTAVATYSGVTLPPGTVLTSDSDADPGTSGPQPTDDTISAVCGDSTTTPPETCDDGGVAAGDGCNSNCRREVRIVSPDGVTIASTSPTITGTADPGATVVVTIDGVAAGSATANGSGAWSLMVPATLSSAPHTASATATDTASGASVDTATFTIDATTNVAITSPAEGASTRDTTPTIRGTAEPGASVAVSIDGTAIGTVTATAGGMFTITPTVALAVGSHTVTAVATDALGNMATDTNTFVIDRSTNVAITSPADGATLTINMPTIAGTTEAGATVVVTIDGTTIGMATGSPAGAWSVTPSTPLADGEYTVVATATDAAGNTAMDTSTFIVDTGVAIAITQPDDGALIGDATPTIVGTSDPGATVVVTIDGEEVGTATVDAAGNWLLTVPSALDDGEHTVVATATDPVGNTASTTSDFTTDTKLPAIEIASPGDGTSTSDLTPTISGSSDPGAIVTVVLDGTTLGSVTADISGSWSIATTSDLAVGDHTVTATTTDGAGNTGSDTNVFEIDTSVPAIEIVTPEDGSETGDATPPIEGTTDPNVTVQVLVDGVLIDTVTAAGDGTWSVTLTDDLAEGEHIVVATATDAAGNTSSDTHAFEVDLSTRVAIEDPEDDGVVETTTPVLLGTAEPGADVELEIDGVVVGTTTAGTDGRWTFQVTTPLASGAHTLVARATDALDHTAEDTADFDIDLTGNDDDGDGVRNGDECPEAPCRDTDDDGTPDQNDPDDDGDGIPTAAERPGNADVDSDDDDVPDYLDPDDDNDGVPTRTEAPNGTPRDTDLDTASDHLDPDDDGDGITTRDERPDDTDLNTDDDDAPNYLDPDDDNDTIPTSRERADGETFGNDVDDDDAPNWLDVESDGDGSGDENEGVGDADDDGVPNYLDPDSIGMNDGGVGPDAGSPTGGLAGGALCNITRSGASTSGAGASLALVVFALVAIIRRRRRD